MDQIKTLTLLSLLLVGFSACNGAEEKTDKVPLETAPPTLSWVLDEIAENPDPNHDYPTGPLSLEINGVRHVVVEKSVGNYQLMEPGAHEPYDIPAESLTAVWSWWAGGGDVIYARMDGDSLLLMQKWLDEGYGDEEMPEDFEEPGWEELMRLPIGPAE